MDLEKIKSKVDIKEIVLIALIAVAATYIQFNNSNFLTVSNISEVFKNTSLLAILSIGMMTVMLTGGIDLSVGSTVALAGMTSGILIRDYPDLPIFVNVLVGLSVGLISGLVLGTLVGKWGMIPTIASLGMRYVLRGLTYLIGDNKWISAHEMTPDYRALSTDSTLGINNLIFIAIIIYIIALYFFNYSKTGRSFYAVGSNPQAAKITGLNINTTVLKAYAINGLLSGLVGVLWVSRYASAQGDTADGYEMNVIAAAVLGGISLAGGSGRVTGLFLGVLVLGILDNALPLLNASVFWEDFITGAIIIIAVVVNILINRREKRQEDERRVI